MVLIFWHTLTYEIFVLSQRVCFMRRVEESGTLELHLLLGIVFHITELFYMKMFRGSTYV